MQNLKTSLEQFTKNYETAATLIADLSEEQAQISGVCGNWGVREIVAHWNGWLTEMLRRYRRYGRGTGDVKYNIDVFNSVSIRMRQGHSWPTLRTELDTRVQAILDAIANLKEAQREDIRFARWLHEMAVDFAEHTLEIEAFREAQGLS